MKVLLLGLSLLIALPSIGQELVLEGTPSKVVEIDQFGDRATYSEFLSIDLRITRDGDNYFWASRGNIQLAVTHSGIYTTYIAVDGSGYIRTVNDTARERFIEQSPSNVLGRYTYVEHISEDLTSISIYGR
ncbi:MAG: hypothetical protein O2948_03390 [Proteobacteria bacterium]|nr:hypothetical protein [Pseudomonadota bacterium]MDA0927202.1 hypothetical protein [Pseudomonadota bacterium]